MRSKMKKYLSKWYLYLIAIVISVVVFCLSITIKTNPSKLEKVNFFLGTYDALTSDLDKELESQSSDDIKQINITFSFYGSSSFEYVYETTRSEMDFYILPLSFLNSNESRYVYFADLNEAYLNEYFGTELSYLHYDATTVGIKVYDHLTKEGYFKDYVTYATGSSEEDFYLFYNRQSQNLGNINESKTDHALCVSKILFNL